MEYTDYQEIRKLAKSIYKEDKKMIENTENLWTDLETLKKTFLDNDILVIESYVKKLSDNLEQYQEDIGHLCTELLNYAQALEDALKK